MPSDKSVIIPDIPSVASRLVCLYLIINSLIPDSKNDTPLMKNNIVIPKPPYKTAPIIGPRRTDNPFKDAILELAPVSSFSGTS